VRCQRPLSVRPRGRVGSVRDRHVLGVQRPLDGSAPPVSRAIAPQRAEDRQRHEDHQAGLRLNDRRLRSQCAELLRCAPHTALRGLRQGRSGSFRRHPTLQPASARAEPSTVGRALHEMPSTWSRPRAVEYGARPTPAALSRRRSPGPRLHRPSLGHVPVSVAKRAQDLEKEGLLRNPVMNGERRVSGLRR